MLKKILIAAVTLVVLFAATYWALNTMYNRNSTPAEQIADSIDARARGYYSHIQSGTFDYDTEQSVLNTKLQEYNQLTQWAIRPHVKSRFERIRAEAEEALASAQRSQLSVRESQEEGEARAAAAAAEMRENQRRAAEQN